MTSLYARLVGPAWAELPGALRDLYGAEEPRSARGTFRIQRGPGVLGRLAAAVAGMPRSGDAVPTEVVVTPNGDAVRWERRFDGASFATNQREKGGLMVERVGPFEYGFALRVESGALVFDQRRVALALGPLRVPLPRALHGKVEGRVWQDERGAIRTEVGIAAPVVGRIVRYTGAFEPPS